MYRLLNIGYNIEKQLRGCDTISENKMQMIIRDVIYGLQNIVRDDLKSVILYGSYARGDYDKESDIDIAVLVDGTRLGMKKYTDDIAELMVDLNLEYDILVSFCCIPYNEFIEKKGVLPYYKNIEREGVNLIA